MDFSEKVKLAERVLEVAKERLPIFLNFLDTLGGGYKGRSGGAISVRDNIKSTCLACSRVGKPPDKKIEKYFDFSLEKGKRLFEHKDHLTSHESRNKRKEQYGGAIMGDDVIVSFSGFPEKADSLFSLVVLQRCEGVLESASRMIVKRAQIQYLYKKWLAFCSHL